MSFAWNTFTYNISNNGVFPIVLHDIGRLMARMKISQDYKISEEGGILCRPATHSHILRLYIDPSRGDPNLHRYVRSHIL